jgi:hypothetical protein
MVAAVGGVGGVAVAVAENSLRLEEEDVDVVH